MAIKNNTLQLEEKAFKNFMQEFKKGKHGTKRLGQAFYDHFKLERLADQSVLYNIHAKDGDHAIRSIRSIFIFN